MSFKVTSLRYNTLMSAFFFQSSKYVWNALFNIADFSFISSILAKSFPFIGGRQVRWIRWFRHDYGFVFGQKLTHKDWCVLLKRAFWYCQQLLFRFFLYFLNCNKTLSIGMIGMNRKFSHDHTPIIRYQLWHF